MNVLVVTDSTILGGAEAQMLALFRGLLDRGHGVHLMCAGKAFATAAVSAGLDAEVLSPSLLSARGILAAGLRVRRACRTLDVDVVHSEGVRAALASGIARVARRQRPGFVMTVHNLEGGERAYSWATRILRFLGGSLTTVSDSERRRYLANGFPAERCRTVYNGVAERTMADLEMRARARDGLGIPRDSLVVAHVGRLSPEKAHRDLFQAIRLLPALSSPVRILIAGEGPERVALERTSCELGLQDRIAFLGFRRDVEVVLDAADLLALPSHSEALPMVLLEAMAGGLPVVASRVGGIPEIVTDGREGWLVDPGDVPGLAHAIGVALLDEAERRRRGAAGHARVREHFSFERMVDAVVAVYREEAPTRAVDAPHEGNGP